MLQPREQQQNNHHHQLRLRPLSIVLCIFFICISNGLAQYSDGVYIVEPTPALKLNNQADLTTVLLLNNNQRGTHGRYLNVKPTIGLLTSTARTFIQEGVTTEYATQVVGTTLDNGRLYAQLLKKSSRVLYDKEIQPTDISPTAKFPGTVQTLQTFSPNHPKSLLQSHNDIIGDQDWQLIDDHLLLVNKQNYNNLNTFVRNTDFVSPLGSPPRKNALLVFPTRSYTNPGDSFTNETFSVSHSSSSSSSSSSNGRANIAAQKVLHAGDLPTFTIKNMFAPSGFSWDSPIDEEFVADEQTERARTEQLRAPKLLQNGGHRIVPNELRNLPTVTYYGFAEFTTIVGDTVIVFSPSTSAAAGNQGQVTSIKGEATLNNIPQMTIFSDLIQPTLLIQQQATRTVDPFTPPPPPETPTLHQHDDGQSYEDDDDQSDLTMPDESDDDDSAGDDDGSDEEYSTTTEQDFVAEDTTPKVDEEPVKTTEDVLAASSTVSRVELESSIVSVDETTTSTSTVGVEPIETSTTVMLSKPSNDDISKIFASLASVEAAKKLMAQQTAAAVLEEETTETVTTTTTTSPSPTTTTEKVELKESERSPKEILDETTTEEQLPESTPDPPSTTESQQPVEQPPPRQPETVETIEPETKVSGGVTTIFFEDDPFQAFEATPTQQTAQILSTSTSAPTEDATTESIESTTPSVEENATEPNEEQGDIDEKCEHRSSEIVPTLVPKTLTYLTTFFISDAEKTSTSIESNVVVTFDVNYATKINCAEAIQPTVVVSEEQATTSIIDAIERPNTDEIEIVSTTPEIDDELAITTTPRMIVTEKAHVTTEEESFTTEAVGVEDDDEDSGEEIELIYKTLYTTYTYLTTFFHESTTSVSSRKEILTNVITSTVNPSMLNDGLDVTELLSSISPTTTVNEANTMSTSIGVGRPTTKFQVQESDLVQIDDILREDQINVSPTASLNDQQIQSNGVKTYYTTYTYFTTIFVDGETEITSRTEIYTNYVSGDASTAIRDDDKLEYTVRDDDNNVLVDITPTSTYESIQRTSSVNPVPDLPIDSSLRDARLEGASVVESSFVSSSSSSNAEENQITMVTDVRSSSSDGDRHIIENINKQWNGLFEDQISSESNTEEILPSSTLLLQTSYTTFTYFTTMYIGNTASNILSRLETITNVVTETLQPTQTVTAEDSSLPITYFTTYTYWTTLYKDGEIATISREETVSNVVTPTSTLEAIASTEIVQPTVTVESPIVETSAAVLENSAAATEAITVLPSVVQIGTEQNINSTAGENVVSKNATATGIDPTTFYTTYTYYTTSYVGEDTVLNSRFETVTNIVTPIPEATAIPASPIFEAANVPQNVTAIVDASTTETPPPTPPPFVDNQVIALNQGKIVDAEGISTLFYTTKTIATRINNEETQIVESSSSLSIDEAKKALSTSETDPASKTYKTGLVRLIHGTMIANRTTTLYESKVIGIVIEGRYGQIIESTSSFLIERTISPNTIAEISPTSTQSSSDGAALQTAFSPTPSADVVEGSISDGTEEKDEQQFEDDEEDEDDDEESVDENGRPKSRLTFQSKKRTFTPVIRPFASRNRPQFAPKRKNAAPGGATIITRSDLTPTITATPALKSDGSRGRFSSNRKSSSAVLNSSASGSSRKFSRSRSSASGGFVSSSAYPGGSGSSRKGLSSSRIQPTSSYFGLSSRRGGVSSQQRGSGSSSVRGFSSAYAGNSRLRIKATPTAEVQPNTNIYTTQEPDQDEENITQGNSENGGKKDDDEEEVEVTTESSRRQNPLLKLRRPIVGRNLAVSQRRNPLTQRVTTTTTTTTTTPKPRPRAFQRPPLATFQSRPRPASNLFPPRGLFRPQTINQDLDDGKKPSQDEDNSDFGDDIDGDYDDEDDDEDDEELDRNRRDSTKKKNRVKRQVSSFRNRFRRPTPAAKNTAEEKSVDEEPVTQRSRTTARYSGARSNKKPTQSSSNSRIRPTKASSSSRSQFTLREKDTVTKPSRASSFRRPTTSGLASSRRTPTTKSRPKAPRLKSYSNSVTESSYTSRSTAGRSRQPTSRGRSTTRSRTRTTEYQNNDPIIPAFDGTITVTHHIPTEITIPVINGKITEYKNVVTAHVQTEVLAPNQYNTLIDRTGSSLLVLVREDSTINNNGATEVTQFILHETPTTSVIFTPTTIRGRRTSFSHIIPSTVYDVENVVSTIQPQIAAQAPLANILLSQLLLGNLGGLQQQQLNPLIGLGGQQQAGPATPTTEFKTRTTTYVTTVTNAMSTVIPLTFRGKEILTTIVDSSVNVITATEFITDTIVVTPTVAAAQQVNSLLLPLLLQQQAQGQLPIQNSILPQQLSGDSLLNNAGPAQNLFQDANFHGDLDSNRIQKVNLDDFRDVRESEEFPEQEAAAFQSDPAEAPRSRKRNHHRKAPKQAAAAEPPSPALETSIVTLYVSGRRPGEFSTVLSTVVGQDSSLRKRHAAAFVEKSAIVDYDDLYSAYESEIKEYLLPATNDIGILASSQMPAETQSLESIVGDVSRWFESQSDASIINQSPLTSTSGAAAIEKTAAAADQQSHDQLQQTDDKHFLV